jgi:predicted permease
MPPLPRFVVGTLRLVIPPRRRDEVISDLTDEYARMRQSGRARWWLLREWLSVLAAYTLAPIVDAWRAMPLWLRDVQLVLRGFRRGPIAALAAAALLSTGLLAVLLTSGLARTLLFRPVSATHGDAVRRLASVDRQGRTSLRFAYRELQQVEATFRSDAVVSAVHLAPAVIRAAGADTQTLVEVVDGEYFEVSGNSAILGRSLSATDDVPPARPAIVISEPFWRHRFDASPAVIGETVAVNGEAFTIVGVAAAAGSSSFLGASVDGWVPMLHADALLPRGWRSAPDNRLFNAFVLPRAAMPVAEARLSSAAITLSQLDAEYWRDRRLQLAAGRVLIGSQRTAVTTLGLVLAALAALILLASAFNISGVLLARATTLRRQVAIHLSIGSGRATILRRQMFEGALLGLAGSVLALALYAWLRTWFAEIAVLPTLALRLDLPLDPTLAAAVALAGLATGLILSAGPALWTTRLDLAEALRDGDVRGGTSSGIGRTRSWLVSAQLCLSLALIAGATSFVRTAASLAAADLGFDRAGLVAMDFDIEPTSPAMSELPQLAREALQRAEAMPGVVAAAMSNRAPVDESTPAIDVRADGPEGQLAGDVSVYLATAAYFDTVGVPIVRGRAFTRSEGADAGVVIVNEALAQRLWPDGDALERALYLERDRRTVRVVGIARNARYRSIAENGRPHVYLPTAPALSLTLLVRTEGNPRELLRGLQRELDAVGPGLVGFFPRTLDDHLAIQLLPARAAAGAATGLGALALLLSAVGLYGLVSWFVELRRREIGIRIAVGATSRQVRTLIVKQAMAAALPGIVCGLLVAIALGVTVRAALFGVAPADPVSLGAGVAVLAVVVACAAYVPGRRASQIDPGVVLRN